MRLTVVGCSGSFPGPEPGLLLPGRGRRATGSLLDLGQRRARAPCSGTLDLRDLDAVAAQPPARRPLLRPREPLRRPLLPPRRRRVRRIPVYGPRGHGRAHRPRLRHGTTTRRSDQEFDFRRVDRGAHYEIGPLQVDGRAGRPPGRGLRDAGRARRPLARLLRRHRPVRGARRRSPGTPTCCSARRRSSRATTTPPDLHLTGGEAARPRAARPVSAGCCSPTSRRGTTRDRALAEATPAYDGPLELAQPGATYDV